MEVVSVLTHLLTAVIGRHFYLIRAHIYATKLTSKLFSLKNPPFFQVRHPRCVVKILSIVYITLLSK